MDALLDALVRRGWSASLRSVRDALLPPDVARRYPHIPQDITNFLTIIQECTSETNDIWFLTAGAFAALPGPGFSWNGYERMELEGLEAETDMARVVDFWDHHFPFMMAAHSDYDYLAVRLHPDAYGAVVHGFSPYWTQPTVIAPSFPEFRAAYLAAASTPNPEWPLSIFL